MTDRSFLDKVRASEEYLSAKPELKELIENITPVYAGYWKTLGILLGLLGGFLDAIEAGNPKDQFWCCNQMLQAWLDQDTTASWNKIIKGIESPAIYDLRRSHFQSWVSSDNSQHSLSINALGYAPRMRSLSENLHSVAHQVDLLEARLKHFYTKNRYKKSQDEWSLHVPDYFTSVTLIHHKNKHTEKEKINIANLLQTGDSSLRDKITNISWIFSGTQSPQVVLIEGIAGIGKTILSKEIAYQWATKKMLTDTKLLFLVFLRDPGACKVTTLKELLSSYYYQTSECSDVVSEYLTHMSGKDVTIVLDGYDELSRDFREKQSFILDIINGKVLPNCNIVVTSRPIASVSLHPVVDCRIELLGFSKEDRYHYIATALQNSEENISTLTEYLQQHSRISTLCYIPLNMSMLVSCFLQTEHSENTESNLPRTQTDMVNRFICLSIRRYLLKTTATNFDLNDIRNLDKTHLPDRYSQVVKELTELAFSGLMKDQIVFTDSEVREICPGLTMNSNDWDDLGLLCDIHSTFNNSVGSVSYNFIHFSVQEFLAAYHISTLAYDKQLQVLKETFFEKKYFNMWIMFVGLSNGDSWSFRHFLSGSNWYNRMFQSYNVAKCITDDKIKCIYLFQCFMEAQNNKMCEKIGDVLVSKEIDFSGQNMLASDFGILGFFLKQFDNHQWRLIKLRECQISDASFCDFCDCICSSSEEYCMIETLDLSCNLLTVQCIAAIIKVVRSCRIQEINITANEIFSLSSIKAELISGIQNATLTLVIDNSVALICNQKNFKSTASTLLSDKEYTDVWVSDCLLGDETSENFFSALDTCESISSVYLANIDLLDSDMKTVINVLKTKTRLTSLCIIEPSLSDRVADEIVSEISKCSRLNSSSSMCDTVGQVELVVLSHSKIQSYNLNDEKMIQCLHSSKAISSIKLHNCLMPSEALKLILNIPLDQLESLDLTGCNIGSHGLSDIISSIKNHQGLKVLNLSNNDFTASSVENLIDLVMLLKALNKIMISDVAFQSDSLYSRFYKLMQCDDFPKCLEEIVIGNGCHILCNLDHKDLQKITTSPKTLYMLYCTIESVSHLENFLHSSNALQTLSIFKCKLNNQIALDVSQLLKHTASLKEISLCVGQLDDATLYHMFAELSSCFNRSLMLTSESVILGYQATIGQMTDAFHYRIICKEILLDLCKINRDVCNALVCMLSSCTATLEIISVKRMSIQLNETLQIIKVLTHCEKLRVLDIGSLIIPHLGAANDVCNIIKKNSATIKRLCLSNYNLSAPDTEGIKLAISALTSIQEIVLENCNITCGLASCLALVISANNTLKEISCNGNNLQAAGCITLAQSLTHISTLTILNINGNSITDKGAFAIAEIISCNVKLRELYLNNNSLQEAGVIEICASLFKLIGLEVLSLSKNHITYQAARAISTVTSKTYLEKLFLNDVKLSTHSMIALAKVLQELHSLKSLDISYNHITDKAAKDVASIISRNLMLESIDISGNAFQVYGLREIFMSMSEVKMLKVVNISNNCIVNGLVDHVVAILESNTMLETLSLNNCYLSLTGIVKICQCLSRNSRQLCCIDIANNNIDCDAASEIGTVILNSPNLKKFLAGNNVFGSTGICVIGHALSHCRNLMCLNFGNIHMTEPTAEILYDAIRNNSFLQNLYLDNCNLTHKCFKKIAESLKNIETLKALSCVNNNMFPCISDLVSVLEANTLLQELFLRNTNLQTEGAIVVLQSLIKLKCLKVLDCSHNNICVRAARELATVVSRNSHLEKLYLQCNHLQSSGIIQIVDSISIYKSLRSFNFAKNDITGVACNDLTQMVAKNVNTEEILLFGNKLQSGGISCLFNPLYDNALCLKKLDVGNNSVIAERDAEKLLKVFSKQSGVEKLCISFCRFQFPTACKLIKSLINTSVSLREIDCSYCNFSFNVFRNFHNMHLGDTSLEVLSLPGNNLMTEGVIILSNLLKCVATLKHEFRKQQHH
ncbi:protein NLRC5-like [Dysidea avara]|uniref:protein NLRC5-like n=1 Tax=Dysidea avara TaxID=196820 RepID=UPI0033247BEA